MKRKIALLMAMVFAFVSMVPVAFAEDAVADEIVDVVEEAVPEAEEEIPAEETDVEIPAEDAADEEITEEIPVMEEITEETKEDAVILDEEPVEEKMTLQAVESDVQTVADAITEEMLTSDREPAYAVTKNLDMSLLGDIELPEGVTVTFESDNTDVIKNDGTVIRAIGSDTDVKVIATVSKEGSDDAVKELNFKVLDMKTAVYYSENFYSPDNKDEEIISFTGSTCVSNYSNWNYNTYNTNFTSNVSSKILSEADGYSLAYKRVNTVIGGQADLTKSFDVGMVDSDKIRYTTTINVANWGSGTKRIDWHLYAKGTDKKAKKIVEVRFTDAWIYLYNKEGQATDFSNSTSFSSPKIVAGTDYKMEIEVDYVNKTYHFYVNGTQVGDTFCIPDIALSDKMSSLQIGIIRQNTSPAEFRTKDIVITGEFDLSDPQIALDMIDESCFTYTDSGKITEDFSFVIPENVTTLAGLYGFDVTLTSSKPSSIAFDGYNATVTKGEEKQNVTLTVTIGNAEKAVSKTFEVKVHNLAATNMIEAEVPVITQNGENKDISVDVYCENLVEGETSAPVYLFAVRKEKDSGKIDAVQIDSAVLTIGASDTLTASLPDGGDNYDYVVYVWDSFENQKSMINQPPAEPTDLEVTGTTSGTADLGWTKADDDRKAVSSYNVYRNGNYVGSTSFTNYTGENLDFGDTYTFGVTTVDDSGLESEYMAEVEATTKEMPTITYVSPDPVAAPNATQTNNGNILHPWTGSNTTLWTRPAEADGRMCHETTVYDRINADESISKIYSFFYTRSPFTYIDADARNIVLEITYFDVLEDGATSETISVEYQGGSSSAKYTNTGYWKTKVIEVNNAKFTEAAKTEYTEKYNIRFKATKPGLKVYQTTVANANEYVRPAASIKMTDALTLRDILVYREDGQISYDEANGEKCFKIESGNYLEMDVETIASNQRNVNVEITYFDEGDGSIILEYPGEEGSGMEIIQRENSGEWKTKVIALDDAMLDGSLTSNFGRTVDLKLFGDGDTKIKAVRVY